MRKAVLAIVVVFADLAVAGQTRDYGDDLIAAAKQGDADVVKALLAKGANVNSKNSYGATALTFAADKGHLAVTKLLLQNKADVNVQDTFYKATPLDWAVMRKHVDIVKALVAAGATGASGIAWCRGGRAARHRPGHSRLGQTQRSRPEQGVGSHARQACCHRRIAQKGRRQVS